MVLSFFKGSSEGGLDHIDAQVTQMLEDCRHTFDSAMAALLAGGDPAAIGNDIDETDMRVNRAEQEIRRELVVHASVHGAMEVPTVMNYTLMVKKIERIGDQNKNIFDLAQEGVSLAGAPDLDRLIRYRDEISAMFGTVNRLLSEDDEDGASRLMVRADELLDEFDELVIEQVHSHLDATQAVPRALLFRYLKRVVANLANVVSTIVSPIDQVDYHEDGSDSDM